MKKLDKEQFIWRLKELYWWFQIYMGRVLWSYAVLSVLIASGIAVYVYSRPPEPVVAQECTNETVSKLQKCTVFVYDILKTNTKCVETLQECGKSLEMCTEKLEEVVKDPNYREAGD